MKVIRSNEFIGQKAWDSIDIERIADASIRLHWTDQPYKWHVNDGPEVFAVLSGQVAMHTRKDGTEEVFQLNVGDIFHAESGDEHVAHPIGQARILVVERVGSI